MARSKPTVLCPKKTHGKIPKGPTLLYFIRNRKALIAPDRILGVFAAIMSKYGDLASFRSGIFERTYLVSDPVMISEIVTRVSVFLRYPNPVDDVEKLEALIGKGMVATHAGNEWKAQRQSVTRYFTPQFVMQHYSDVIERNVKRIVDEIRMSASSAVNISRQTAVFSGRIMNEIVSPFHETSDAEFMRIKEIMHEGLLEFHKRDYVKRAKRYKDALIHVAAKWYESFLRNQHKDELSLIAVMHAHLGHTDSAPSKVLDEVLNLMAAGYETTATTLNWIIYALALHPEIAEELREQIAAVAGDGPLSAKQASQVPLLNDVVDEAMRLYPALWFNVRYCEQECTIAGHKFVKGARIMILPFLANRHPHYYKSADRFDPRRFSRGERRPAFPFGHGPRICLGKSLAELELRLFVSRFVSEFVLEPVNQPNSMGGFLLQPDTDIVVNLARRESRNPPRLAM
jgi:cytochrome P450